MTDRGEKSVIGLPTPRSKWAASSGLNILNVQLSARFTSPLLSRYFLYCQLNQDADAITGSRYFILTNHRTRESPYLRILRNPYTIYSALVDFTTSLSTSSINIKYPQPAINYSGGTHDSPLVTALNGGHTPANTRSHNSCSSMARRLGGLYCIL